MYECACGERFSQPSQAILCTKCRVYAPHARRVAVNLSTGESLYRDDVFPPVQRTPEQQAELDASLKAVFNYFSR
tara:strand:- start:973 stop:1197 length:225 start_codon:yes stop_codon:yes gene_type:complete